MKRKSPFSRLARRISAPVRKTLALVARIGFCAVLACCIIVSVWLSLGIARASPRMAVLISSAASGAFSFTLALAAWPLLRKLVRYDERGMREELRALEEELDRQRRDNEAHEEKEVDFQRRITLLENLTFNMETYRDVFKVCFRDYQQEATIKKTERFNEQEGDSALGRVLGRQGRSYDEVVSVMDCTVSYQRGIDLQKIKIAKVSNNTVVVSGLTGEYISMPRFDYKDFFNELRHVRLDKGGNVRSISVDDSDYARQKLIAMKSGYRAAFKDSFLKGKDSDDSEELTRRAEDFIRIILQPIYAHVEFDDAVPAAESRPLLEFLKGETGLYKALLERKPALVENAPS